MRAVKLRVSKATSAHNDSDGGGDESQNTGQKARNIYHFLRRSFGQQISVSEVVDFYILDVIPVRDVNLAVDVACGLACAASAGLDRRDVHMLNAFARLQFGVDLGGRGSCARTALTKSVRAVFSPGHHRPDIQRLTSSSGSVYRGLVARRRAIATCTKGAAFSGRARSPGWR